MLTMRSWQVVIISMSLLMVGCGSLGSRSTPAPVEEPGQVVVETERVIVDQASAPLPSTIPEPSDAPAEKSATISPQTSSATTKLRLAALSQQRTGKYSHAAATLERALRISPRDAKLWHQLAQVRLSQKKWRLAVNMAAKSNALATQQRPLQRKNWLIIAKAYRELGQTSKANAAMQRAK